MSQRILFLRTDSCTVEPRIQKEASSLTRAGYSVTAFGWDRRSEYPRTELLDGVTYERTRLPAPYGSKLLAVLLPLFWIRAVSHILSLRPQIVHACDLDSFIPALVTKPLLRHLIVYDIFDTFADKITGLPKRIRRMIDRFDRFLMRFADAVIVTDLNRKERIKALSLQLLEVIMNVPPATDVVNQDRRRSNFRLCFAGNIHAHRGLRVIAEAVRNLENVEVSFAGWITRSEDADFLHSERSLRFLGKLPYKQSLNLIAESDASLAFYDPALPINALASSNKIFEAMSVGRPVITNSETTMAPIVEAEQCGCLVPYGDVRALRDVIVKLRDNPSLCAELGNHGYKAFRDKYNWEIMEQRLTDLYSQLLGHMAVA